MQELKNRQALHEFFIDQRFTAGLVLLGTEVKSLREGKANFADSYCFIQKGEAWVRSLNIAPYSHGSSQNHDPLRIRKLLLQKREIKRIEGKLKEKGYTLVPLRIYFDENNLAKMEIGLARGKKLHDKRESIKQKEMEREMKRHMK